MRAVFALVLILGLGLAGFAVYMAQGYMAQMSAERDRLLAAQRAAPPTVRVLVVNADKAYGERITAEDVKPVIWQKDSVPKGIFMTQEELFPEGTRHRYVLRSLEQFEPILATKVTKPGEDAGITSRLGAGMSAFAIRVDVSSGVSGFLRPGDRVDVYWTGRAQERDGPLGGDVTKRIQTGVRLIAVDQIADSDRSAPVIARTVTVEATPQQVASLAQAQSTGRLSLSLVGAASATAEVVQVDQRSLLGIIEEEVEIVEGPRVCTTKVRRGTEVVEQEIPCTN